MREPELIFAEDGSIVSWLAQDGMLLVGISDAEESHEHRLVLAPEDLAPMLLKALFSGMAPGSRPVGEGFLYSALFEYVATRDARKADAS